MVNIAAGSGYLRIAIIFWGVIESHRSGSTSLAQAARSRKGRGNSGTGRIQQHDVSAGYTGLERIGPCKHQDNVSIDACVHAQVFVFTRMHVFTHIRARAHTHRETVQTLGLPLLSSHCSFNIDNFSPCDRLPVISRYLPFS